MEGLSGPTDAMPAPRRTTRELCLGCARPPRFCWCTFLPAQPIELRRTRVLVLTHPHEVTRSLRTVPLLERCLAPGACSVVVGRRFATTGSSELRATLSDPHNLLLFPTRDAADMRDIPPRPDGRPRVLVALDATWEFARNLYNDDRVMLDRLTKVKLAGEGLPASIYAIRKQPTEGYLCTLEAVSLALSILEEDPAIFETCLRPLRAVVRMQQAMHAAAKRECASVHVTT